MPARPTLTPLGQIADPYESMPEFAKPLEISREGKRPRGRPRGLRLPPKPRPFEPGFEIKPRATSVMDSGGSIVKKPKLFYATPLRKRVHWTVSLVQHATPTISATIRLLGHFPSFSAAADFAELEIRVQHLDNLADPSATLQAEAALIVLRNTKRRTPGTELPLGNGYALRFDEVYGRLRKPKAWAIETPTDPSPSTTP